MRFLKTMVLSTAHIMFSDDVYLRIIEDRSDGASLIIVDRTFGGWSIIVLGEVIDPKDFGLSDAFWHIMYLANCEGCDRIEFDRDEEKDPNLQTFEW